MTYDQWKTSDSFDIGDPDEMCHDCHRHWTDCVCNLEEEQKSPELLRTTQGSTDITDDNRD